MSHQQRNEQSRLEKMNKMKNYAFENLAENVQVNEKQSEGKNWDKKNPNERKVQNFLYEEIKCTSNKNLDRFFFSCFSDQIEMLKKNQY